MAKSKHRRNHSKKSAERSDAIAAITQLQRRRPGINAAPAHEDDGSKVEGMQEIGLNGVKLRGRTKHLGSIDDASFYLQEVKALVDGVEVPVTTSADGIVTLGEAPPKGSELSIMASGFRPGVKSDPSAMLSLIQAHQEKKP